jgi:hypothetical protein
MFDNAFYRGVPLAHWSPAKLRDLLKPHAMLLNLGYFIAIQQRQQIPGAGVATQKLAPCPAA